MPRLQPVFILLLGCVGLSRATPSPLCNLLLCYCAMTSKGCRGSGIGLAGLRDLSPRGSDGDAQTHPILVNRRTDG